MIVNAISNCVRRRMQGTGKGLGEALPWHITYLIPFSCYVCRFCDCFAGLLATEPRKLNPGWEVSIQ